MKLRILSLLLVILLISGFAGISQRGTIFNPGSQVDQSSRKYAVISDLTPHDPLEIYGNIELADAALAEGWAGNGTASNPYILENYFFNDTVNTLVIGGTTDYVTIRNCSFVGIQYYESNLGITLDSVTNALVTNCTFSGHYIGIRLVLSQDCIVRNNSLSNVEWGINVIQSENITIEDNSIVESTYGIAMQYNPNSCNVHRNSIVNTSIFFSGDTPAHFIHNLTGNTVNGLPFGYFYNISNLTIDGSNFGGLLLANSTNIVIENGTFVSAIYNVFLAFCTDCTVANVTSNFGRAGFFCDYSDNCTVMNSTFYGNEYSVLILESTNSKVTNNTIYSASETSIYTVSAEASIIRDNTIHGGYSCNGIYLDDCSFSIIEHNSIAFCNTGLNMYDSSQCQIIQNSITNNDGVAIFTFNSSVCNIFHNNISYNEGTAISTYESESTDIAFNTIEHNNYGLAIGSKRYTVIRNNTISHNSGKGIITGSPTYCQIVNNTITWNSGLGIYITSLFCTIYGNIIGYNAEGNARDGGAFNTWDDGISQGNRWGDYTKPPYYLIPGPANSIDRFPSVIEDVHAPLVNFSCFPSVPTSEDNVTVTAEVFEVTGIFEVILSYSIDEGMIWTNSTMTWNADLWITNIPANPENTLVLFKVYATDVLGYSTETIIKGYTVLPINTPDVTTTITTTTTTTLTTSTTVTTSESVSGTNITTENTLLSSVMGVGIGAIGAILIILIINVKTRRSAEIIDDT